MSILINGAQVLSNTIYRFIPRLRPRQDLLDQTKIIAHRGAWNNTDRLENTLPAFEECLKYKIWSIEFDIHWTRDNVPVVHHDPSTERVFKKNLNISETDFSELRTELPQIPRLDEVVHSLGSKIHFMVEIKTDLTSLQVKIIEELFKGLEPIEDYHFMALDIEKLKVIHFVDRKCLVSIARLNIKAIFNETIKLGLGGFTGQYLLLRNSMKDTCIKNKINVGTGFPDSKNLLFREINRGVNWIYTNHSIELSKLL